MLNYQKEKLNMRSIRYGAANEQFNEDRFNKNSIKKYGLQTNADIKENYEWGKFREAERGNMYRAGLGVDKDIKKAIRWYVNSLHSGGGDPIDAQDIIISLTDEELSPVVKEAKQGDMLSLELMANVYYIQKKYIEAFNFWTILAKQDDAQSQRMLGYMYAAGKGADKNFKEAVKWYLLANAEDILIRLTEEELAPIVKEAKQGDTNSIWYIAEIYYIQGKYSEAFKFYTILAQQGNAEAQYSIGYMYAIGEGIQKNEEASLKWLKLCAKQGRQDAVELLLKLKKQ
jgi:TPR repeat protein